MREAPGVRPAYRRPVLVEDHCWAQVQARAAAATFVYAVTSTGVYCRPRCPSRRPRRDRVRFFADPAAAEAAGFRACRRCHPGVPDRGDAALLAACRAMDRAGGPLPVAELAGLTGWSPRHLHRRFLAALSTTPRAYGEAVRVAAARAGLRTAPTVTEAAFGAGYGSLRGFYAQAAPRLGMPATAYAAGAPDEPLRWAATATPVGVVLVVASDRGVCAVRIAPAGDGAEETLLAQVRAEFPRARLHRDDAALHEVLEGVRALARGVAPGAPLPLDVRGTAFQALVWQALGRIPRGETRTYAQVAAAVGRPTAVRAVARACATNPAALVVPCHRVVRTGGGLGGYRWGLPVKAALLAAEREPPGRADGSASPTRVDDQVS